MNQILVTKKLYITPELKKKKKMYKIDFILSIFLVVALLGFYVYAEYDRNKSEEVSQDLLSNLNIEDKTTVSDKNVLVVVLNGTQEDIMVPESERQTEENNQAVVSSSDGKEYTTIATINIPTISVKYPILQPEQETTESIEETLKVSPCKFWGPEPNEVGNFCIVGHNYRNNKFFSKVPTLSNGDIIEITDMKGKNIKYSVYDKYTVDPTDVSCTTQLTNGRKEITLITCTNDNAQRVIVKAKAQ